MPISCEGNCIYAAQETPAFILRLLPPSVNCFGLGGGVGKILKLLRGQFDLLRIKCRHFPEAPIGFASGYNDTIVFQSCTFYCDMI